MTALAGGNCCTRSRQLFPIRAALQRSPLYLGLLKCTSQVSDSLWHSPLSVNLALVTCYRVSPFYPLFTAEMRHIIIQDDL